MNGSILAHEDRMSMGNGMYLSLLSARELMQARREARSLTTEMLEQALCSNACLVAHALRLEGEERPLFQDAEEVLDTLTADEIEILARRWDEFRRATLPDGEGWMEQGVNPDFDESRFLKQGVSGR